MRERRAEGKELPQFREREWTHEDEEHYRYVHMYVISKMLHISAK